jgi:hypothetical protein
MTSTLNCFLTSIIYLFIFKNSTTISAKNYTQNMLIAQIEKSYTNLDYIISAVVRTKIKQNLFNNKTNIYLTFIIICFLGNF